MIRLKSRSGTSVWLINPMNVDTVEEVTAAMRNEGEPDTCLLHMASGRTCEVQGNHRQIAMDIEDERVRAAK